MSQSQELARGRSSEEGGVIREKRGTSKEEGPKRT